MTYRMAKLEGEIVCYANVFGSVGMGDEHGQHWCLIVHESMV